MKPAAPVMRILGILAFNGEMDKWKSWVQFRKKYDIFSYTNRKRRESELYIYRLEEDVVDLEEGKVSRIPLCLRTRINTDRTALY